MREDESDGVWTRNWWGTGGSRLCPRLLRKAESDLDSASSWGMFDILGGGLISTLIKHNDMDDAQAHMEEAKGALEKLSQELKDVDYQINLDFTVSDFLSLPTISLTAYLRIYLYKTVLMKQNNKWKKPLPRWKVFETTCTIYVNRHKI